MLGERIKERRIVQGLTQRDLAKKLNISFQTVSKYEKDINQPDAEKLKLLSKCLDCSIDYLVGNSNNPSMKVIEDNDLKITYDKNYPYDLTPEQLDRVFKLLKEYRLDVDGIIQDIKNGTIKDEL